MSCRIVESKSEYQSFCQRETGIPLFSQDWWLNAVAGPDNWNALLALQGDTVVGTLPFVINRRLNSILLTQPKLTQSLGPWVRPSSAKYSNAMAKEKDILGALADGLPKFDIYRQNWDTARTNWLPFYWRGFEQTTRYTYVLTDLSDLDAVWQGTQSDIKSNIRKAKNRFGIRIRFTEDMGELIPLIRKTFERQNIRLPFSEQFLHHVDEAAASKGNRAIILGEDVGGRLHAGTYIVWEADTAYQLLNGYDPDLRESGAGSLCVWSAILKAAQHVNRYDFEGSMLEPVERFFRAFGAKQVPYFQVSRTQSRLLKTAICLRSLIRSGK